MRSLRSMCGGSLKDRCRNSDVRERCGMKEDVVTRVGKGASRTVRRVPGPPRDSLVVVTSDGFVCEPIAPSGYLLLYAPVVSSAEPEHGDKFAKRIRVRIPLFRFYIP
ncbi:hypothetical protein EVAR_39034_1 [Eumeta japonica]|uniref:Uncharacterized protein n=1 Tax=Eumeta variegata TaxID=151549 RepID=A0A4C1WPU0_EUMVA|nr:hypothetical protein EVAR_39034_1 [Eumeta japonica]